MSFYTSKISLKRSFEQIEIDSDIPEEDYVNQPKLSSNQYWNRLLQASGIQFFNINKGIILRNGITFFINDSTTNPLLLFLGCIRNSEIIPIIQERYQFILPLNSNMTIFLAANSYYRLNIFEIQNDQLIFIQEFLLKDIYGAKVSLKNSNIKNWKLSQDHRYLAMHEKGWFQDSLILIDLQERILTRNTLPTRENFQIIWSYRDKFIGLYGGNTILIQDMAMGNIQKVQTDSRIMQATFSNKGNKLNIVTERLKVMVLRAGQGVSRKSSLLQSVLFPQQEKQDGFQFYLELDWNIHINLNGNDEIIVKFVQVEDEVKKVLVFGTLKTYIAEMGQSVKEINLSNRRQKERIYDIELQSMYDQVKDVIDVRIMEMYLVGLSNIGVCIHTLIV